MIKCGNSTARCRNCEIQREWQRSCVESLVVKSASSTDLFSPTSSFDLHIGATMDSKFPIHKDNSFLRGQDPKEELKPRFLL